MPVAALPGASRSMIAVTVAVLAVATASTALFVHGGVLLFILAFFISGFVADAFTGVAHFMLDYAIADEVPILGPIAKEFHEHHDEPALDPSSHVENFTKGAYAGLPGSAVALVLALTAGTSALSALSVYVFLLLGVWGLFFHQIHAYAHMGSTLHPDEFKRRVAEIGKLGSRREQLRQIDEMFRTVPIPAPIRLLQKCGFLLSPARHNLHHLGFETDFSSVNGWSDPLLNLLLRPISRRIKARAHSTAPHADARQFNTRSNPGIA